MQLEILELTIALQIKLEAMTEKEFKAFMKGKALKYDGKIYGTNDKKPKVKQ